MSDETVTEQTEPSVTAFDRAEADLDELCRGSREWAITRDPDEGYRVDAPVGCDAIGHRTPCGAVVRYVDTAKRASLVSPLRVLIPAPDGGRAGRRVVLRRWSGEYDPLTGEKIEGRWVEVER
jgi:hypothetical protein